jgi:AraC-like DNA-binding protein
MDQICAYREPRVRGRNRRFDLRDGLALQVIDAEYLEDHFVEYTLPPGFIIYLQFEDSEGLSLSVGGHKLPVGKHRKDDAKPLGFSMWRRQPATLSREAPWGTRVRVVLVWLTLEWFSQTFAVNLDVLPATSREHLAISRWRPSRRIEELATGLFELDRNNGSISRLRCEIAALDIVAEALTTISPPQSTVARRGEVLPLNKARDFVEANLLQDLPIEAIAKSSGVGVGTLRRLFKEAYGYTISEYVRLRRLDIARSVLEEGGSVSDAAAAAQYTSAANFSTAFRVRFGVTPRQARDGQ